MTVPMFQLLAALQRQDQQSGDAVCSISVHPQAPQLGKAASGLLRRLRHINVQPYGTSAKAGQVTQSKGQQYTQPLLQLPYTFAFDILWNQLPSDSKRALRLVSRDLYSACGSCVRSLHLATYEQTPTLRIVSRLPIAFPGLNELHLQLGRAASATQELQQLQHIVGQLPHLNTFYIDSKVQGDAFYTLAKFLVQQPSLQQLLLPNQCCSTAADQRILSAVLAALPGLVALDLGASTSTSSSPHNASGITATAISATVMRRIVRLHNLRSLCCNASAVPDSQLASLSQLVRLQSLTFAASGSGDGSAEALQGLSGLTSLEIEHPSITGEQLVGSLGRVHQLRVLAVGLCPKVSDAIMPEVSHMEHLEKLTLPFPVNSSHLRMLSRLLGLRELFTWRSLQLDDADTFLSSAYTPLYTVSRIVAGSIQNSSAKSLESWFPNLSVLCLKQFSDTAAKSLQECIGLQTLVAGDCKRLSDEGFACMAGLKALQKLQLEAASQVTYAAFAAVFSSTMPTLQHICLSGCRRITDDAMQLLTGSCRRLTSITITECRHLTDKTLKRLAHCDHLNSVAVRGCDGVTAEGVAALAAAAQAKAVTVSACGGVQTRNCKEFRSGVRVKLDDVIVSE